MRRRSVWSSTVVSGLVAVAAVAGAAACSSSPSRPGDPVLAKGQDVFTARCASCHGTDGSGGVGAPLKGVVASKYPDIAAQEKVISEGRKGTAMPSFAGQLTPEEITAVARYTREGL
jgi:cytochrome c oxidase subunit 2